MAVILRYFTEFGKHMRSNTWPRRSVAEFMHESIVFCSSRSLSHLLMSFLLYRYNSAADFSISLTADLFVCLSVTFRCFVHTNEDTIVRSSASGRTIIPRSAAPHQKYITWLYPGWSWNLRTKQHYTKPITGGVVALLVGRRTDDLFVHYYAVAAHQ